MVHPHLCDDVDVQCKVGPLSEAYINIKGEM
jgi:hypothetical protein